MHQPHEQRVIEEQAELDARLEKLSKFLDGETYQELDRVDQALLTAQAHAMQAVNVILCLRIARFKQE